METVTDLIDRYIAIWNETDRTQRQDLIAQTWSEDAAYIDPLMHAEGRDAIDTMIAGVQAQFPGFRFRRTGEADTHNNCVRFSWELGPEGGPPFAGGVDFGVVAGDHRLKSVTGFLDFAPRAPGQ